MSLVRPRALALAAHTLLLGTMNKGIMLVADVFKVVHAVDVGEQAERERADGRVAPLRAST